MTTQSPETFSVTKEGVRIRLEVVPAARVMAYTGELELVYCRAFGAAPWLESVRHARHFVLRLLDHTESLGFRLVIARVEHHMVGFGYGRIALPRSDVVDERYLLLIQYVGPEIADHVLYDSFELTELAVIPSWQGHGIGGSLHDSLLAAAPDRRAWLLTHPGADRAQALYRSRGWTTVADIGTASTGSRRTLMAHVT